MKRSEFIADLFYLAREKKFDIALARPYAADVMQGDIDLLIETKDIALIDAFIAGQAALKLTSRYRRTDGETFYVFGVENGTAQAIGIDFITSLSLQGIDYLDIRHVLRRAETDENHIKSPHEIDQALILLMTHGIKHGGAIKRRYIDYVHAVLKRNPVALPQSLITLLGEAAALDIIESFTANEFPDRLWPRLRRAYLKQAWIGHGALGFLDRAFYKIRRLVTMFSAPRFTVAVYGVDGAGKTTLINYLDKTLAMTVTTIRRPHFRPALPWSDEADSDNIMSDPHAKPLRDAFTSTVKLAYLLARYWLAHTWPRDGTTLFLYDRYLPDMAVDPLRYRYGGSGAALRLACAMAPTVHASVLIDISPDEAQKRKSEVSPAETKRQADAYRQLIATLPNPVTIKGEMPIDRMTAIATAHIIQTLMRQTRP